MRALRWAFVSLAIILPLHAVLMMPVFNLLYT